MNKDRRFSVREVRALVWLLPVLAVVSWLVWEIARRDGGGHGSEAYKEELSAISMSLPSQQNTAAEIDGNDNPGSMSAESLSSSAIEFAPELFAFDPNTIGYHDLVRLGFTRGEALGIVKYRERGKVFEIPEDFAACYQVSEAMYLRLAPYIDIGEEYRLKPFRSRDVAREPQPSARPGGDENRNSPSGGLFMSTEAGMQDTQPRQDGEQTQSRPADVTSTRPPFPRDLPLIELNTADSAVLVSVSGIGAVTARGIIEYRVRLGGFVRVEQLAEVRGMTEQNYERILEQIFVDDSAIQKIDINFASAKSLAPHPYIRAEALRKLLKQRQLKGGWSTAGELKEDDIFTPEEFAKLSPYLLFNQK